jgi:hypothetical protein
MLIFVLFRPVPGRLSASDVRTALLETGEVDVANSIGDPTVMCHLVLRPDLVSSLHDAGDCSGPMVIWSKMRCSPYGPRAWRVSIANYRTW